MMVASREVETYIARLAQMARRRRHPPHGCHAAPSTDVVTA